MKEKDIKEEKYRSIPEGLKTEIQAHKEWLELSKKQQEDQVSGEEACFAGTKCTGANFNRATLRKANFTCTKLSGAKFQEADLRDADLRGADLSGADFYLADISGAKLCLNDITMEQLGQCLFTPELKQMIQAKYCLMTCKSN